MKIEFLPLSELIRHPRNPKRHAEKAIAESIDRFGFTSPILIDERTGMIAAGHGRLDQLEARKSSGEAAPERIQTKDGDWLVPVVRVPFRDDVELEAYLVADNRTTELGGWDENALIEILEKQRDAKTLKGTGYTTTELADILRKSSKKDDSEAKMDKAAELQRKWKTTEGQTWNIGESVLIIDDALSCAIPFPCDGICTDPPYDLEPSTVAQILNRYATVSIVLGSDALNFALAGHLQHHLGFVWKRRRPRSFPTKHQPVMYHSLVNVYTGSDKVKSKWTRPTPGFSSVIETSAEFEMTEMGHGKSAELFEKMLSGFAWESVADPFCGTGATLIACHRQGRRALMIEKDPSTAAVALERWKDCGLSSKLETAG